MSGTVSRRVDGLAVYERPRPGGPRVVFVHGTLDRGAGFVKLVRCLPDIDAVRYDRRGYGRSVDAVPDPDGGRRAQVADLVAVLDDRPAAVVGHSLGGLIALAAAQDHPELVRSVVAFEPPVPWAPWWPSASAGGLALAARTAGGSPGEAAERFLRAIVGDEVWEALPERTQEARRAEGPAVLADLGSVRSTPWYDPARLGGRPPVVVGCGTTSAPHLRRAAHHLHEVLPWSVLRTIEGAGHNAHTTHPDDVARLVREAVAAAAAGVPDRTPGR